MGVRRIEEGSTAGAVTVQTGSALILWLHGQRLRNGLQQLSVALWATVTSLPPLTGFTLMLQPGVVQPHSLLQQPLEMPELASANTVEARVTEFRGNKRLRGRRTTTSKAPTTSWGKGPIMNCPPTKRLRGLNHEVATTVAFDDPFGDDEDFTQDDLDEIDIIASQAISSTTAGSGLGSKPEIKPMESAKPHAAGQSKSLSRATMKQSRENTFGFSNSNRGNAGMSREPLGNKEQQRQREQSDKEKELNKKCELQFKEAEINEMKTKLHSSEKNKTASPLPRNSPKVLSSLGHHGSGSSSSSPAANGFITKEMFGANVPSRTTPVKMPMKTRRDDFLLHSDAASCVSGDGAPRASLSPVQSLAVSGLNMLSQSRAAAVATSRSHRSCHGAVLFLPLLDLHLSRLCQALDLLRSNSAGSSGSDSAAVSSLPAGHAAATTQGGRLEETGLPGFSMEDTGLAALRLLCLLLAHSDETEPSASGRALCSQKALLQSVLWLCQTGLVAGGSSSSQREELVLSAMKTLLQMIQECVSILTLMSDHQTLAQQLCSQHDPCIFLKLFQYIRTRPDNQATHTEWILLDLQVVQTVVIVFHRQWLDLRGSQEPSDSTELALDEICRSEGDDTDDMDTDNGS
ncbi:hypothetical protein INR49_014160 [Caranx melampygus]|nr:hypothetical protein INR49_014160 [Caranx melampygus]